MSLEGAHEQRSGTGRALMIDVERIPMPRSGLWRLSGEEVDLNSAGGEEAFLLIPPHGSTAIIATPWPALVEDASGGGPLFLNLGPLVRVIDDGGSPGLRRWEALEPLDWKQASLDCLLLASTIESCCNAPEMRTRLALESCAERLRQPELAEEAIDHAADLILATRSSRHHYLIEDRPEARMAGLRMALSTWVKKRSVPLPVEMLEDDDEPEGLSDLINDADIDQRIDGGDLRSLLPPNQRERFDNALSLLHSEATDAASRRRRMIDQMPRSCSSSPPITASAIEEAMDAVHIGHAQAKQALVDLASRREFARRRGVTISRQRGFLLVGPPGIGKTTLVAAFAKASRRSFAQITMSSVSDPETLIGTSSQWHQSSPGRLMRAFVDAGTADPVICFDDLDHLNDRSNSSPIADVLLGILDDSDDGCFVDAFLGVPYPCSFATFMATANDLDKVPAAVRDRFSVIEVTGYSLDERIEICRTRLLPRAIERAGIRPEELVVTDDALEQLARSLDPSIRPLQDRIDKLVSGVIRRLEVGQPIVAVDHEMLKLEIGL